MIEIRRPNVDDALAMARVQAESWREAYRGIVPDDFLETIDLLEWADRHRRLLENPPSNLVSLVAEVDATVVGIAVAGANRDVDTPYSAELFMIYLMSAYWRRGIGSKLMDATARSLIGLGLTSMIVWVFTDNWPGRQFYETLGGQYFRERSTNIAGPPLLEVSYGWPDLRVLVHQD